MGVLNVTPDSFSDGGRFLAHRAAIEHGLRLAEEGADLIDVGGESTRPGAEPVALQEELRRVLPVVEALVARGVAVSIDTQKPEVAQAACQAGAVVVNDVGGLREPEMRRVCSEAGCTVCIMHMQGDPRTMQREPNYDDVVTDVGEWLIAQARLAESEGVKRERIWIDPGIGFGKTVAHNLELLRRIGELAVTGYPVLIGVSRKSFIGKVLGTNEAPLPIEERLEGTLAFQAWAQMQGVRILRSHDILASRRVIDSLTAISALP